MGFNLRVSFPSKKKKKLEGFEFIIKRVIFRLTNVFKYPYLKILTLYKHNPSTRSVIPTIL